MSIKHKEQTGRRRRWRLRYAALCMLALPLGACDVDGLLEVEDPDVITLGVFQDTTNLNGVRNGVLLEFARAYGGTENQDGGQILYSGLLADEFWHSGTFETRRRIDERRPLDTDANDPFFWLQRARNLAELGAGLFTQTGRANSADHALVLNLAGYTYIFFAENYCAGVPFSRQPFAGAAEFGAPETTEQVFERAIQRFDAVLAMNPAPTMANLARVGKARALLGLGRFADARTTAQGVPSEFEYQVEFSDAAQIVRNAVWQLNNQEKRWSVASNEGSGQNTIRFFNRVSAAQEQKPTNTAPVEATLDPRVRVEFTGLGTSGNVPHYNELKYPNADADIPLATGIEARLIEAEALLAKGASNLHFPILNALRANVGLGPLTDPGTAAARVDQFFRERAFWLWLTSHRLGDLRRQLRLYERSAQQIYPSGTTVYGTPYGDQVSLPIPKDEANNPQFKGCLDTSR